MLSLLALSSASAALGPGQDLARNLRHFETLSTSDLSHSIVKRGADPTRWEMEMSKISIFFFLKLFFSFASPHRFNKIREVGFKALGRDFRLVLSPQKGLLHKNFKAVEVEDGDGDGDGAIPIPIDHESFYEGRVFGEMESRAAVHLEDGVMTAKIETPEDVYVIEPSWRHLPTNDTQQMIAYR